MTKAKWSARAEQIESFKVMDLLKQAHMLDQAGHQVVHMEAGEPDFGTSDAVRAAAQAALAQKPLKYTPAGGIPELREAIAQWYLQRYGLTIAPERVLVTSGASAALLMVFAVIADKGESVLMADPGYPCNRQFLRFIEAQSINVPCGPEQNYQLDGESVAQHWQSNTAGVLLASPANPTGAIVDPAVLAEIAEQVRQRDGALVVDELYHGITYDAKETSVLNICDDAFVINSFSKYFGMTGWRLGWLIAPESAVPALERMAQNLYISPPSLAQYAALAAFEPESVAVFDARRDEYRRRRDCLITGLKALGFKIPVVPEGAFYVYADASAFTNNSQAFCWQMLNEAFVAATPGVDFGQHKALSHVRFSYTTSLPQIELALTRLKAWLETYREA